MRGNGVDPAAALRAHESHQALKSVGALLNTGPTGTNVNDLVIALLLQARASRLEARAAS
jgi:glycerate-2-kinase